MAAKRDKANLMAELFGDSFDDLSESALSRPDKSPILESDKKLVSDSKKGMENDFDFDDDLLPSDKFRVSNNESPRRLKLKSDIRPSGMLSTSTSLHGGDVGKKKREAVEIRSEPKPDSDIQSSYVATDTNISRRRRPPNASGIPSSGMQKTDTLNMLTDSGDKGREIYNHKPAPSLSFKAGSVPNEIVEKSKIMEAEIFKTTEGIINTMKKQNELQIKTLEDGFNKHISLMCEMHQKREDFLREEIIKITNHYEGRIESLVKSHEASSSQHSVELLELRKKHCMELENIEAYHKRLIVQISNDHEYFVEHLKSYNDEEIEAIKRIQSKESQLTTVKDRIVRVEENVDKLVKLGSNMTQTGQFCEHTSEIETLRKQINLAESERLIDVEKLTKKLRDCEKELAESEMKLAREKQTVSAERALRDKEKKVLHLQIKNLHKANIMERKKLEEAKGKLVEESRRLLVEFISKKMGKPLDCRGSSFASKKPELHAEFNDIKIEIPEEICGANYSSRILDIQNNLQSLEKVCNSHINKLERRRKLSTNGIECRTAGDGGTHEIPFDAWKIAAQEDIKFLDKEQDFIQSIKNQSGDAI